MKGAAMSKNTGKIVQVIGPVVDVAFEKDVYKRQYIHTWYQR